MVYDLLTYLHVHTRLVEAEVKTAVLLLPRGACDSECLRFRQLISEFSAEKPRAVIYYLVHKRTIHKLNTSLHYLDANFNDRSVDLK